MGEAAEAVRAALSGGGAKVGETSKNVGEAIVGTMNTGEAGAGTPLESNLLAVATAETLAKGKNRAELEEICKFLQLLQAALKAYM